MQNKAKSFKDKLFGTQKPNNSIDNSPHPSQKLDMTLPAIQHKKLSKTNFMEHWLDEALDPQDLAIKDQSA